MEANEISRFGQKEWLELCAIFLKDGVEKMVRNASYFVIEFLVKTQLHFPKEASELTPLLVQQSPCFEHRFILLCILHTQRRLSLKSTRPKSDPKWCETSSFQPIVASGQSLHPAYHYILFGPPSLSLAIFGSTQESFYSQSSASIMVIHRFPFSTYIRERFLEVLSIEPTTITIF